MSEFFNMTRREKFVFLKAMGVKCSATMKTAELDEMYSRLDSGEEAEDVGPKSIRGRRKRVPLGKFRSKLSTEGLNIPDDKVVRWVNDIPGRVQQAQEGGYQLVRDPHKDVDVGEDPLRARSMDSAVSAIVGERDGVPLTAYLMTIDKEIYDEDQRDKQKPLDEMDRAIKSGTVEAGEGQYIPKEGIKYQTTKK